MYSNPRNRGNKHIYRLRWGYRLRILFLNGLFLMLLPFAIYGFSLNSKGDFITDAAIYIGLLALLGVLLWFTLQIAFVFRLETTPEYGKFYGLGKTINFDWEDVIRLDYAQWPNDIKYQLSLELRRSVVTRRFEFPFPAWFAIHYTDTLIPIDTLYGYQHFLSINIMRRLPTLDEQSIHLRHFIRSPLGQDLVRYAPNIFGTALSKYLPDDDLVL
jgi:hypothetical protein